MTSETVMTFVSLLVALLVTTALFAGNFALAYLVDLLSGRGVPPGPFAATVVTLCAAIAALRVFYRWRSALGVRDG